MADHSEQHSLHQHQPADVFLSSVDMSPNAKPMQQLLTQGLSIAEELASPNKISEVAKTAHEVTESSVVFETKNSKGEDDAANEIYVSLSFSTNVPELNHSALSPPSSSIEQQLMNRDKEDLGEHFREEMSWTVSTAVNNDCDSLESFYGTDDENNQNKLEAATTATATSSHVIAPVKDNNFQTPVTTSALRSNSFSVSKAPCTGATALPTPEKSICSVSSDGDVNYTKRSLQ
jgi:hypothetical protein